LFFPSFPFFYLRGKRGFKEGMINKCVYVLLSAHIAKSLRKEERSMSGVWADALTAFLVATTQTILELIKTTKKKGKAAS
jgi:hypothetical protein